MLARQGLGQATRVTIRWAADHASDIWQSRQKWLLNDHGSIEIGNQPAASCRWYRCIARHSARPNIHKILARHLYQRGDFNIGARLGGSDNIASLAYDHVAGFIGEKINKRILSDVDLDVAR
ncbi:hypothetical protein A6768_11575 [Sphingobium yanoikuyae]|uniref:Uncharacterized protein n=1 Tax=Sphingobium yanoikuyae TaxID=13690 RepID=A0A291MZP0_SPHYA|nr:hypothetical protein A6768_11575 [Sphingobium yanoikuyae]